MPKKEAKEKSIEEKKQEKNLNEISYNLKNGVNDDPDSPWEKENNGYETLKLREKEIFPYVQEWMKSQGIEDQLILEKIELFQNKEELIEFLLELIDIIGPVGSELHKDYDSYCYLMKLIWKVEEIDYFLFLERDIFFKADLYRGTDLDIRLSITVF